jgi:hypothetical protein
MWQIVVSQLDYAASPGGQLDIDAARCKGSSSWKSSQTPLSANGCFILLAKKDLGQG